MKKNFYLFFLFLCLYFPMQGQTDCPEPTSPTKITFTTIKSDYISGKFLRSESTAKHLVCISTSSVAPNLVNDSVYKLGDSIGEARVITCSNTTGKVGSSVSFNSGSSISLTSSTRYYFYVYSRIDANECLHPKWCSIPLCGDTLTLFGAPTLETYSDSNTVNINLVANSENSDILLLGSEIPYPYFSYYTISGNKVVGDSIGSDLPGYIVLYKGPAKALSFPHLKKNTSYFYVAWSFKNENTEQPIYSTNFVEEKAHTQAAIPLYWDMLTEIPSGLPAGWSTNFNNVSPQASSNFSLKEPSIMDGITDYLDYSRILIARYNVGSQSDADLALVKSDIITPWVKLNQGQHRILFSTIFNVSGSKGNAPYILSANDTLLVQIAEKGKDNWNTIYTVSSQNQGESSGGTFSQRMANFNGYDAKIVHFRFLYTTNGKNNLLLSKIKVEETPSCDYPIKVILVKDSINENKALIQWVDNNLFPSEAYYLSYSSDNGATWSVGEKATNNPAYIHDLPFYTSIMVRVAAICDAESQSIYSEPSKVFVTKAGIPFFENFNAVGSDAPTYWVLKKDTLKEEGCVEMPSEYDIYPLGGISWMRANWRNISPLNYAIRSSFSNTNPCSWIVSPALDLGEKTVKPHLSFDFALMNRSDQLTVDSVNDQARFVVLISTDGGKTFNSKNIIDSWGKGSSKALKNLDSIHCQYDLSNYSKKIAIGFYTEKLNNIQLMKLGIHVDNFKIDYSCHEPSNLLVSSIGQDSVILSWNGEATEYKLRYRQTEKESYQTVLVNGNNYILRSLKDKTSYTWSVSAFCSLTDSSNYTPNTSFQTLEIPNCDTITNSKVRIAGKNYMQLTWQGNAAHYIVAYRLQGTSTWDSVQTDTNIVNIESLKHSTNYEYKIQAWCSKDGSSISAWTAPKVFTTLLACLCPENVHICYYNWTSVKIAFVSQAPNTILAYKEEADTKWNYFLAHTADTLELLGLQPNTAQLFKVAAICESADTSVWSEVLKITTPSMPECYAPQNLKTESITATTVNFSWTSSPAHINYSIAYKAIGKTRGDTIGNIVGTSYNLSGLQANTPYSWAVRGNCDMIVSPWNSSTFKTSALASESEILRTNFKVFADKGHISIQNPNQYKIEKIELYNVLGQSIASYIIASNENILIPINISERIILLRLFAENRIITYKLSLQ
ncbi:MAG: fibronectin type III domain-containing protein [Bacteroidales bacterium]